MTETVAVNVDESRSEFEAWFGSKKDSMKNCGLGMIHIRRAHDAAWSAWQASRAALVVDIASHTEFEIEHMISPEKEGYSIGWIDGRNYSVEQVRAAGITVKGDS